MPKFLVKSNISKDGKLYEPGAKIELSEKEAAEMPWAVEAVEAEPAKEITDHHIKFLQSRGYGKVESIAAVKSFIQNLTPPERAGFFVDAAAWEEKPAAPPAPPANPPKE